MSKTTTTTKTRITKKANPAKIVCNKNQLWQKTHNRTAMPDRHNGVLSSNRSTKRPTDQLACIFINHSRQ